MKIALLLRGFHFQKKDRFGFPLDARRLLPTLLEQVLAPLRREHALKVFAITYPSPIEAEVTDLLKPDRLLLLDPKGSAQLSTFRRGLQEILADPEAPFDRVIVTRFDLVYLQSVLSWKIWDRIGVFFPWREYEGDWNWCQQVGDAFHVIDWPWVAAFEEGIGQLGGRRDLHQLYRVLESKELPLHFVEPGFHDSNTLFGNAECTNPIYRIGNRPKRRHANPKNPIWLRKLKRLIPYRLWELLTQPKELFTKWRTGRESSTSLNVCSSSEPSRR